MKLDMTDFVRIFFHFFTFSLFHFDFAKFNKTDLTMTLLSAIVVDETIFAIRNAKRFGFNPWIMDCISEFSIRFINLHL